MLLVFTAAPSLPMGEWSWARPGATTWLYTVNQATNRAYIYEPDCQSSYESSCQSSYEVELQTKLQIKLPIKLRTKLCELCFGPLNLVSCPDLFRKKGGLGTRLL